MSARRCRRCGEARASAITGMAGPPPKFPPRTAAASPPSQRSITVAYTDRKSVSKRTSRARVLERGIVGAGAQVGRGAVEPAADAAAHRQHDPGGAVVGALAAVLVDAAAELRELQHERVAQQPLVRQVGVERGQRAVDRAHQVGVGAVGRVRCPARRACRSRRSAPRTRGCRSRWPSRRRPCAAPARARCSDRSPSADRRRPVATRSSVANAACAVALTKARCG